MEFPMPTFNLSFQEYLGLRMRTYCAGATTKSRDFHHLLGSPYPVVSFHPGFETGDERSTQPKHTLAVHLPGEPARVDPTLTVLKRHVGALPQVRRGGLQAPQGSRLPDVSLGPWSHFILPALCEPSSPELITSSHISSLTKA